MSDVNPMTSFVEGAGKLAGEGYNAAKKGFDAVTNTDPTKPSEPAVQASAAEKKLDILGLLAEKLGFGSTENMLSSLLDRFLGSSGVGTMIASLFNDASGAASQLVAENDSTPQGTDGPGTGLG